MNICITGIPQSSKASVARVLEGRGWKVIDASCDGLDSLVSPSLEAYGDLLPSAGPAEWGASDVSR